MKRDDAPQFKQTLAAVYSLYGKEITPMVLTIWFEALKGYDVKAISDALSRHCVNPDNGQFLPKPADVVRLIDGGSEDAALLAWAKVDRAVRSVGPYATVVFDDPLIHFAVTHLGGWVSLGQKTDDEWPFVRNQFVTLYRAGRSRTFEYPRKLVGIAEAESSRAAQRTPVPTLIGDAKRAEQVLARGEDHVQLEVRSFAEMKMLENLQEKGKAA